MQIGRKVLPHGGHGEHPGGIPIMRAHHKDGITLIERGNLLQSVNHLFICGINLTKNLVHNLQ